jgi:hypothetical protein
LWQWDLNEDDLDVGKGHSGHSSRHKFSGNSEAAENGHLGPKSNEHFAPQFADGENPCFMGGGVISRLNIEQL